VASIAQIGDRFRVLVRLKGHRPVSKYCDTEAEAIAWGESTERALRSGGRRVRAEQLTVGQAIDTYRRIRAESGRPIAAEANQHYMLEHLAQDLGPEAVRDLIPRRLTTWAQERARQGAGPGTINMELSALGTVLRTVASFENLQLPDVVGQARPLLHHLQLIAGGGRRSRRPVGDELERVLEWFAEHRPAMRDAVELAALSGLRRGELVAVLWDDLDAKRKAVLVRNRKHPRVHARRNEYVPLFGKAWTLAARQPRQADRIFPIHPQTLTKAFTDCCRELGVPDLHLHDLRREANHQLREVGGLDREERKRVLGHLSDRSHDHYLALTPEELHAKYRNRKRKGS
jgi:integrase